MLLSNSALFKNDTLFLDLRSYHYCSFFFNTNCHSQSVSFRLSGVQRHVINILRDGKGKDGNLTACVFSMFLWLPFFPFGYKSIHVAFLFFLHIGHCLPKVFSFAIYLFSPPQFVCLFFIFCVFTRHSTQNTKNMMELLST